MACNCRSGPDCCKKKSTWGDYITPLPYDPFWQRGPSWELPAEDEVKINQLRHSMGLTVEDRIAKLEEELEKLKGQVAER